jgi:hypothetical protein
VLAPVLDPSVLPLAPLLVPLPLEPLPVASLPLLAVLSLPAVPVLPDPLASDEPAVPSVLVPATAPSSPQAARVRAMQASAAPIERGRRIQWWFRGIVVLLVCELEYTAASALVATAIEVGIAQFLAVGVARTLADAHVVAAGVLVANRAESQLAEVRDRAALHRGAVGLVPRVGNIRTDTKVR